MAGLDAVRALLRPLHVRVAGLVARAVVQRSNDAEGRQRLQVVGLKGVVREGLERFQQYGIRSRPLDPDGDGAAEAVAVFLGGSQAHGLAVACDDRRHRPAELEKGEVALYTDEHDALRLERGELVKLAAERLEVTIGASTLVVDEQGGIRLSIGTSEVLLTSSSVEVTCDTFSVKAPTVNFDP